MNGRSCSGPPLREARQRAIPGSWTRSNFRELTTKIEQLVHEHIERSHQAVIAAVQRAFLQTSATQSPTSSAQTQRAASRQKRERSAPKQRNRRTKGQLNGLCDELCAAVESLPDETMAVLAERIGTPASALHRPMTLLRQSGRIRSVGARRRDIFIITGDVTHSLNGSNITHLDFPSLRTIGGALSHFQTVGLNGHARVHLLRRLVPPLESTRSAKSAGVE